jgi:hypothetical protein
VDIPLDPVDKHIHTFFSFISMRLKTSLTEVVVGVHGLPSAPGNNRSVKDVFYLDFNTQLSQHTQLNHGVRCFAEPCRHQDDKENYTMAQVASLQASAEDGNSKRPHPPIIHGDNQMDRWLVVGWTWGRRHQNTLYLGES